MALGVLLAAALIALGTACKPEPIPGARERSRGESTPASPSTGTPSAEPSARTHTRPNTNPAASSDPTASPGGAPSPAVRGLWVLAEGSVRVLDDPARVAPLLERAKRLGVTDLFVQVYRGGRAWYATKRTCGS